MSVIEEDLDGLIALQIDALQRVAKCLTNHKKTGDSRRTRSYFEGRLNTLKELRSQFNQRHQQLVQSDLEASNDYYTQDYIDQFEEKYVEVYSELIEDFGTKFSQPKPTATTTEASIDLNSTVVNGSTSQQLPAMSFTRFSGMPAPEFSGKYTDWPAFYDSFLRLVHNNIQIQTIEKFHLLKQALKNTLDSDIREMPLTTANYDEAWNSVIERYHHSRVLFTHFMHLFTLQPVVTRENATDLKQLVETSRTCLNALKQLKVEVDDCGHVFAHLLIEKLPKSTIQLWEQQLGESTEIPTFKALTDFLTARYRTLEAIDLRSQPIDLHRTASNSHPKTIQNNLKSSQNHRSNASHRSETRIHHMSTVNDRPATVICVFCQGPHILRKCPSFRQKDNFARKAFVDTTSLCSNCLSSTHQLKSCLSERNCNVCGQRHHTLIHQPTQSTSNFSANSSKQNKSNDGLCTVTNHIQQAAPVLFNSTKFHSAANVLLPTAIIKIIKPDGSKFLIRTLVDQGSTGALISERVCQTLQLKRLPFNTVIQFPNEQKSVGRSIVHIIYQSRLNDKKFEAFASVVKNVTINLPTTTLTYQDWPHLRGLELADPDFHRSAPIDMLIGSDSYADILLDGLRKGHQNEPIAQNSHLGWLVSGKAFEKPIQSSTEPATIHCSHVSLEQLDTLVKQFYTLESIPADQQYTSEQQWCRNFYNRTTVRQPNGKYLVRLPLKTLFDPSQIIGKSHQIAKNRFHQLERKLNRHPEVHEQYHKTIREYFDLRQITPVSTTEDMHLRFNEYNRPFYTCCTLPHHAVIKADSLTTKCRVVYDASAKSSNGKSLNDILCTGPRLQNDLSAVLLNWRLHKYVITADITRMYRCIDVHEDDVEYQRILWYNPDGLLQEYKLTTVTFGTASAPYTAIETLHRIAHDMQDHYPLAVKVLRNEVYVDDIYTGSHTIDNTLAIRDQTAAALESAGIALHKWASSSSELLKSIPTELQSSATALELNSDEMLKTLGMRWQPSADLFRYKINFDLVSEKGNITKRTVLSTTAKLFDPMGLINPVVLVAKIFLKRIWTRNLEWDEQLPTDLRIEWLRFLESLTIINEIQIPRWLHSSPNVRRAELHTFCDGSLHAYAAVSYIRIEDEKGNFHTNIIAAKSKVTPKPPINIPRIELCAAVLGLKLAKWITKHLSIPKDTISIYYWVDATIVLSWIRGDINRWPTFVANRIGQIHTDSHIKQWHHISTHDNPADIASRGSLPAQLLESKLYWNGPDWLSQSQSNWPVTDWTFLEKENVEQIINVAINGSEPLFLAKYSSFLQLRRIVVLLFRFRYNCTVPQNHRRYGASTVEELNSSLFALIRIVQRECFSSELKTISKNGTVPNNSVLTSLAPFLDQYGILRVLGRGRNSRLPYNQKHPIILPKYNRFTELLIDYAHQATLHGGPTLTLTFLRKRFWIVHARKVVAIQLRKCVKCARADPKPVQQLMGDLPQHRVIGFVRPFLATGVDYTGAFELKASRYRGHTTYKGYIALFVCLATKAIHLEAVTGMDTYAFLNALHRFVGRRGLCHDIYSDCGSNFIGADKVLKTKAIEFAAGVKKDIAPILADKGIQWHFTPPYSPNFGGIWEANVKATKRHLHRAFTGLRLTYEELSTALVRIESCLNSRPICPLNANTDDLEVLTPGHFLIGDALLAPPEPSIMDLSPTRRYCIIQRIIQQFWSKWSSDWLSHLQSRPKWASQHENLMANDMVVVKDDRLPPNKWTLGRIIKTHPGDDGLVRVVTVRTKCGIHKRSISKICKLPVQNQSTEDDVQA